ncbi:MAG: HEPN domain-containing protein [Desulfurococcales archaeon]|nr:HEPN domain-containing protein [Desulfurococcales archaeon]
MREHARWWILSAKRDLERARHSLEISDRVGAVFWSQQAAEKALRGLLLHFKGGFPKTHSIRRFFEELGYNLGLSEEELEAAYELTQYYHLSRYPDIVEGVPDEAISRKSAGEAVAIASRIVEESERAVEEEG